MSGAPGRETRAAGVALAVVAAGLLAEIALHLLEPPLAVTWAYAHLGRDGRRVAAALVASVALPLLALRLARTATAPKPPLVPQWPGAIAAATVLWLLLLAIGVAAPAPPTFDSGYFKQAVVHTGTPVPRWVGAIAVMRAAMRLRPAALPVDAVVFAVNAAWASVALCAAAGCARLLARDRAEQALLVALAWTAFGTLQVSLGYLDVYPIAIAATALFLWAALRALAGEIHVAWALAIAAAAAFFYIGLALLAPAALVVCAVVAGEPRRRREVAVGAAVAVVAAGLATLPLRGLPFDWPAFLAAARHGSAYQAGYSPDSSLLPLWYLTSLHHAAEVASTAFLVDPVGSFLAVGAGASLVALRGRAAIDGPLLVLATLAAVGLAYAFAMDPVFGAYADWDLFSFGAVATSLLGGACLVRLGRPRPRETAMVGGLAVAAALVHLLARLHALPIDAERHVHESPIHRSPAAASPAPGAATR